MNDVDDNLASEQEMMLACAWLEYLSGPTGYGPMAHSTAPVVAMSNELKARVEFDISLEQLVAIKRKAFADAVRDVTGEELTP